MQKLFSLLLALSMLFMLVACDRDTADVSTDENTSLGSSNTSTPNDESISLPFSEEFSGGIAMAVSSQDANGLTADRVLNRCSWEILHAYILENSITPSNEQYKIIVAGQSFSFSQYAVPEDVVFTVASNYFNMDDTLKSIMKASDRYNSANGTFWCTDPIWFTGIDSSVEGYDDSGNGEYALYVEARVHNHPAAPCSNCATDDSCVISRPCFTVKIKATAQTKYIITDFTYIDTIPDSATKL